MQRGAVMRTALSALQQGRLELTCADIDDSVALPAPFHHPPAHQRDRRLRQPPPGCYIQHLQAAHAQQMAQAAWDVLGTEASPISYRASAVSPFVSTPPQGMRFLLANLKTASGSKPKCCKGVLAAQLQDCNLQCVGTSMGYAAALAR